MGEGVALMFVSLRGVLAIGSFDRLTSMDVKGAFGGMYLSYLRNLQLCAL